MFRFVVVVFLLAGGVFGSAPHCPPAPFTGCYQSKQVVLSTGDDAWMWTDDSVDYGVETVMPESTLQHALCIWDGLTLVQSETVAPSAPATLIRRMPVNHVVVSGAIIVTPTLGNSLGGLSSELTVDQRENLISQLVDENGKCWCKAFGFRDTHPPDFSLTPGLSHDAALTTLDLFAARHNAKSNGNTLDMIEWFIAVFPSDVVQQYSEEVPTPQEMNAQLSALHALGWYAGMWFKRDGFSSSGPAINPNQILPYLNYLYYIASTKPYSQDVFEIIAYVEGNLMANVGDYGYNTGYTLEVLEFGVESGFLPAGFSLTCTGDHSYPGTFENSTIFGCVGQPVYVPAANEYDSFIASYVSANPDIASAYLDYQKSREQFGRMVWAQLKYLIKQTDEAFQHVYMVDNAYLDILKACGVFAMRANVESDYEDVGRRTSAMYSTASAWLMSYRYGLSEQPAILPEFVFGITPIV